MRVVLDTNVFISGLFLPMSVPGRIVQAWHKAQYTLVVSDPMLDEIERVLNYPKIQQRLGWSSDQFERYVFFLRFYSDVVSVTNVLPTIPEDLLRDPKDIPILATFLAGSADWLVSGDDDLITMRDRYPICNPREFLPMLGPWIESGVDDK